MNELYNGGMILFVFFSVQFIHELDFIKYFVSRKKNLEYLS